MRCPYCRHPDSRVVDSREANEGDAIRRRRSCPECGRRFTTVEETTLAVVKRSGVTEPFSRSKVISGVRKACQGRPVDEDSLALLAQRVEETLRAAGAAEVPADEVGLAILEPLRDLDEVAYLRFASVYRSFESLGRLRGRDRSSAHPAERGDRPRGPGRRHSLRPASSVGRHRGAPVPPAPGRPAIPTTLNTTDHDGRRNGMTETVGAPRQQQRKAHACASSGSTRPPASTPTTR